MLARIFGLQTEADGDWTDVLDDNIFRMLPIYVKALAHLRLHWIVYGPQTENNFNSPDSALWRKVNF